ncbi:GNAT family N-acetyltransferase [Salidesulfovibrio onnuriiensis]|uniref:GNAT family N-acetyltransferase n=1 Tax=Salidesulfovibrio onnuriiensis TaxID=2583823 RepID=UPI0011C81741|nr:GNAT family N-acetyltransferase [Salidesulfovibrio onnuriiensis]
MLSFRELLDTDVPVICGFPRTPAELFYMFPSAQWPLAAGRLMASAAERCESTVVVCGGTIAGYANFIHCTPGHCCSIGNVIVNPQVRRQGVGTYLIRTMIRKAFEGYDARAVRLRCFHANLPGIRLYETLGFRRTGAIPRQCPGGCIAPVYEFELRREGAGYPSCLRASA